MSGQEAAPPQMIDWSPLTAPVPPWGHLLACSERDIDTAIQRFRDHGPKRRSVAICVTRGDHSRTLLDFFDEWNEALQLHWRGRSWDDFYGCIRDMDWIHAKFYIYVVTNADQLLIANNSALHKLIHLFTSSADEWADNERRAQRNGIEQSPLSADDRAKNAASRRGNGTALFHVLFQCDPAVEQATRQRLEEAGAHLEALILLYDSEESGDDR